MEENKFIKNLDELLYLTNQKQSLTRNLKKNYKLGIHYIIDNVSMINIPNKSRGGQNKHIYLLTLDAFEIFKNSFNLRNRYIIDLSSNIKCINLCMCIENQTIGFIQNCFKDIYETKRQYMIGNYKTDLYFIKNKLVIECDENNHSDRDPIKEREREDFIISKKNYIIRYNPNVENFDLSNVIKIILQFLIKQ